MDVPHHTHTHSLIYIIYPVWEDSKDQSDKSKQKMVTLPYTCHITKCFCFPNVKCLCCTHGCMDTLHEHSEVVLLIRTLNKHFVVHLKHFSVNINDKRWCPTYGCEFKHLYHDCRENVRLTYLFLPGVSQHCDTNR